MAQYQIKPISRKEFELTLDNVQEGKIRFSGTFKRKAEILIRNTRLFYLSPKSIWSSIFYVTENGKTMLDFKMKWTGKMIITSYFEDNPVQYFFKPKGVFKRGFILMNEQNNELFSIVPSFKLKQFNFEFDIEMINVQACPEYLELLLLTSVYLIDEIRRSESSASN